MMAIIYSINAGLLLFMQLTCAQISWTQLGGDLQGAGGGDQFGYRISMNGDGQRVAIGASYNDDAGVDTGHVQVYEYISGVWTQVGADIDGSQTNERSGYSVSLNDAGDVVGLGVIAHRTGASTPNAGAARVYQFDSGAWTQLGNDILSDQGSADCGSEVSLNANGSRIAIGCRYYNGAAGTDSGIVRIYEYDSTSTSWVQIGSDLQGLASSWFGMSVSINAIGDMVAVGGPGQNYAQVYEYNSGINSWEEVGTNIDGVTTGGDCGRSVALSADGDIVAVSCPFLDSNTGETRVYQYNVSNSGDWTQIGSSIIGEAVGDYSGYHIAMDNDGDILAVGAPQNDGTNGDESVGHVRVFQWDIGSSDWVQIGDDLEGDVAGDQLFHVSLSNDGHFLAAGAHYHDGVGSNSGMARVYEVNGLSTTNPTVNPTEYPTLPSNNPTTHPTQSPTTEPTVYPTVDPSTSPTLPSMAPSNNPSASPTLPTNNPSSDPTMEPTAVPTSTPTCQAVETACTETYTVHLDCDQDQKLLFAIIGFLALLVFILSIILCCCHRRKSGYVQIMNQLKRNQIEPAEQELLDA